MTESNAFQVLATVGKPTCHRPHPLHRLTYPTFSYFCLKNHQTAVTAAPWTSGVPGMIARLLGATVVLTEQDELLSLLDRNLDKNFAEHQHPRGEGGIRREALDWERTADTDGLLASLWPSSVDGGDGGGGVEVEGGEGKGAIARRSTRLEFILCAE